MSEINIGLAHSLRVQWRVIGALLMREIITRYGRHNIGFLWLLAEPILFTTGVVVLWSMLRHVHGSTFEVVPFIVTGYSALLLWRTCSYRGLKAIEPNRSLLHHRPVKIQDIFYSRMILEVTGVTASFMVLNIVMIMSDMMRAPVDIFIYILGWFFMSWFSVNLGIILGCLSEYSDTIERLWHPISYFMLAVSGTFFMVEWLPPAYREAVYWVPIIHPIEMMRAGYWGDAIRAYYDISYIAAVCFIMTLIAHLQMADPRLKRIA